ncbi:DUF1990 family protein [Pseudonocardia spinosispora]|uniref:DUF1990 family protein n=1 Tax=Pseudonocardia spinosispora TaxID=103441 RepID=UPI000403AB1E|nr:DUF1990 domain-containing protein [Pseudonocardia spinosispora]
MGATTERLARHLRRAEAAQVTYPDLEGTRRAVLPDGYHHVERRVRVGHGDEVFHDARTTVFTWGMQRRAGLTVFPADIPPKPEHTVLVVTGLGPIKIVAPCRIIYTVDESDRTGFGYGTLPGHPESGEEAFLVERDQQGDVWAVVRAFSRPATWYSRLGSPVARLVQRKVTNDYLRAFE